jgi:crotonobetainyl-CoA:carnitine CoA-transferase CaiB-like acyl-CoA transferase
LFGKLCHVVGHPEWKGDDRFRSNPARVQHRRLLSSLLQDKLMTASVASWRERLDAAGIPNAPLRSSPAVLADSQTAAVDILQPVPRTRVASVGLPLKFDGERPRLRLPAPRLGEHTFQVLEMQHD